MTEASQQRSLRQLVGPVGADYQRRALPPGWVWAVLAVLLAATWPTEPPATAAAALVSSAVVVHWPQRGRLHWLGWRLPALAVLAALLWGPDVLSQWFEHGLALTLMSLASLSIGVHVWQSRQVARQLQASADALDDAQLLALLPVDAARLAQQWRAGDDRHAPELSVVMHLAVMHAALAPRMRRQGVLAS
ncbi:hypothetical protein D7T58_10860 [Stenotrophomonas maltophilia]|nr:hypothetical protein [Stenotrophomonas maltophilia]MBA0469194.1 hypothetical protein [Stenotrophomonas maltophilia]MBA0475286.1 hypothetical protein [Stenotrophomonas maltophilia]MBA0486082.1 hypothetical protein [Stenotrophomonas maltophilia]